MKKKAFTLIEMLIVLTVVAILIPTTFSIVYVIMRQQVRIYRVIETRRQGDYILTFIKDRLVRSKQITSYPGVPLNDPLCTTAGDSFTSADGLTVGFLDNDDNRYRMYVNTTTKSLIFETPLGGTGTALNNTSVEIENFSISCARRASLGAPLVNISYTIKFKDNTAIDETDTNSTILQYQTKVKLRE